MAQRLPPEVEQLVVKYQQVEQQLASVLTQKSVVVSQIKEIDRALNVLNSVKPETEVFKNTGFALIKVPRDEVIKELNERREELQIRLTSLEKMESLLRKQLDEIRGRLDKYRTGLYASKTAG
ncbi:MAG: prefoldin subunit beta [Desulfurococcales archaeon ex4484_204]|nr:MAG: prefoldin subunit beta [Desulfurococcales archaeon ex4484_204]